jgi:hypothetical protein
VSFSNPDLAFVNTRSWQIHLRDDDPKAAAMRRKGQTVYHLHAHRDDHGLEALAKYRLRSVGNREPSPTFAEVVELPLSALWQDADYFAIRMPYMLYPRHPLGHTRCTQFHVTSCR